MINPYHDTNNLRLEVEQTTTGLPNLIKNPSGELGSWGWVTPVANTYCYQGGGPAPSTIAFRTNVSQAAYFTTEFLPATVGKYYSARFDIDEITASHNVKVRFEWYDTNKALLSSATQSSAFSSGTGYYGAIVAPASTAYVKLRVDFYNGTGNPSANAYVDLYQCMVTETDTGTIQTARTNMLKNPNAETNASYWYGVNTTVARSTTFAQLGTASIRFHRPSGSGQARLYYSHNDDSTVSFPVTAGKAYTFSAYVRSAVARNAYVRIEFNDNGNNTVGTATSSTVTTSTSVWTRYSVTGTAPSTATKATFRVEVNNAAQSEFHYADSLMVEQTSVLDDYFDGSFTDTASLDYAWTGTANASTSTATTLASTFGYSEPYVWQNILGPTNRIEIDRDSLNLGTLSAEIIDALLDPAVADEVRPGKYVRLQRQASGGTWESVFEGKLTNAVVNYERDPDKVKFKILTRITLTAADNIAPLANTGESRGVATIANLPYILEGKGVPWNVNGSGNQVTSATVVSANADATVLDQVAITRDSALGYAWVDRNNVLNVMDALSMDVSTQPAVNGTFETDVTGWSATNGTLTRDTATFRTGVASMKVTATAGGDVVITTPTGTSGFRIGSKQPVDFAHYAKAAATGRSITWRVRYYNSAGSEVSVISSSWTNTTGGFTGQTFNNMTTSGSGAVYFAIEFTITGAAAGEIHYFDDISAALDVVTTFSDISGLSYSTINADFNTDRCINRVNVKWLRYNATTGSTEEITYNADTDPAGASSYRDQTSIDTWGTYASEFTIHGTTESAANIRAYAASILAANATPVRRANSLVFPVLDSTSMDAATLDLYDLVSVVYSNIIDDTYRITGIKHSITPDDWLIELTFDTAGSVASPTFTPSPPAVLTGDMMVGQVTMWAGSTPPSGWLLCNGQSFSSVTYPTLAAVVGDLYTTHSGTTYYVPDMRVRIPIGSGTGKVLGSDEGVAYASRNADHSHTHNHGAGTLANATVSHGGGTVLQGTGTSLNRVGTIDGTNNGNHTHNISGSVANGLSAAHPFTAINFIIRAV